MNIDSGLVAKNKNIPQDVQTNVAKSNVGEKSFKEELSDLNNSQVEEEIVNSEAVESGVLGQSVPVSTSSPVQHSANSQEVAVVEVDELNNVIKQLATPQNINKESSILQTDEVLPIFPNKLPFDADIQNEELEQNLMLNNDMSINKPQDKMSELKTDINFAQNGGEAFSSFLGQNGFRESAEELKEDETILSSMSENIAMINRAMSLSKSSEASAVEEVGAVIDRIINHTTLNLTENDINFFISLAHNNVNLEDVGVEEQKSVRVSERLINMLSESMRNNNAFRLNFDNDISIIIKVSREGRISAHFLPGSDIAENYLRNNLSSLVQRFEEENIPYDELTHHKQKRNNEEQQNKKDKN